MRRTYDDDDDETSQIQSSHGDTAKAKEARYAEKGLAVDGLLRSPQPPSRPRRGG